MGSQDRAGSIAQNTFGDAAEEQMCEPMTTARAHHDQIDVLLASSLENVLRHVADASVDRQRESAALIRRQRALQTRSRLAQQSFPSFGG